MLTIRKLPNYPVWHVESDDRWELAMTFLRTEEYYESSNPSFQGRIFSLEEYMDWYVREYSKEKKPYGAFTYASDWSAFNIPGTVVRTVRDTFVGHSAKEMWLFAELEKQRAFEERRFYLIGNKRGADDYFEHEFRHALFALIEPYRNGTTEIIDRYAVPELRSWILARYAASSLIDEIQSYALTGWPKMRVTKEMGALKRALKVVERQFTTAT